MDSTEFYRQILGLDDHWTVGKVDLQMKDQTVKIDLEYSGEETCCPECGKPCPRYDRGRPQQWRHLDTCQMQTLLNCSLPRIKCMEHGVRTISCPWAAPLGRFTLLFEAMAINLLQLCKNQTKTAHFLKISFDQVNHIMTRAVERGLSRRSEEKKHSHLGVDEKSMKKRHTYVTVLSDTVDGAVIDVSEGRTIESTSELLTTSLSEAQRSRVKTITMDMWEPYRKIARKHLPQALAIHDRFHIAQYLTGAVDKTRRSEANDKTGKVLKGQRFNFLRNFESVPENKIMAFSEAMKQAVKTAEAWKYKEIFRKFFAIDSYKEGKSFLKKWCQKAGAAESVHLRKVARSFINHKNGILNYLRSAQTNSVAENLNGRIQQVKCIGRGFRQFKNFRVAILFHCGKLDLNPLKTQ